MKRLWQIGLCCLGALCCGAQIRTLPTGAVVIETKDLPAGAHPNRALVLWMLHPKKNESASVPPQGDLPSLQSLTMNGSRRNSLRVADHPLGIVARWYL